MYLHVLYVLYVLYVLHVFYVFYVLVCVLTCMRIYTRRRHSSITSVYKDIYIYLCIYALYMCVTSRYCIVLYKYRCISHLDIIQVNHMSYNHVRGR